MIWTGYDSEPDEFAVRGVLTRIEMAERVSEYRERSRFKPVGGIITQRDIDARQPGWYERSHSTNSAMHKLLIK